MDLDELAWVERSNKIVKEIIIEEINTPVTPSPPVTLQRSLVVITISITVST
jgi:hypothetical protein